MSFTRSSSALYGIHRFFKVDVVVFCEGGQPLIYNDALKYAECANTLDTLYWSSIAQHLNTGKSYHFKSVGCKITIDTIGAESHRLGLNNITVCRDSDYDRILGRHSTTGRIGWTMGYSWESDVATPLVLENLALNLLGNGADGNSAAQDIRFRTSQFEHDAKRWVEIDISLCSRQLAGIFEREKPLASIDMAAPPKLRTHHLTARLAAAGYSRKPRRVVVVPANNVSTLCFGKLISKAFYHTFLHAIRPFVDLKIGYELFMRMAISETLKLVNSGHFPSFKNHIMSQRAAFA